MDDDDIVNKLFGEITGELRNFCTEMWSSTGPSFISPAIMADKKHICGRFAGHEGKCSCRGCGEEKK